MTITPYGIGLYVVTLAVFRDDIKFLEKCTADIRRFTEVNASLSFHSIFTRLGSNEKKMNWSLADQCLTNRSCRIPQRLRPIEKSLFYSDRSFYFHLSAKIFYLAYHFALSEVRIQFFYEKRSNERRENEASDMNSTMLARKYSSKHASPWLSGRSGAARARPGRRGAAARSPGRRRSAAPRPSPGLRAAPAPGRECTDALRGSLEFCPGGIRRLLVYDQSCMGFAGNSLFHG